MSIRRDATKEDGVLFQDEDGEIYTYREVRFVDISSMGLCYIGYVTKEGCKRVEPIEFRRLK